MWRQEHRPQMMCLVVHVCQCWCCFFFFICMCSVNHVFTVEQKQNKQKNTAAIEN